MGAVEEQFPVEVPPEPMPMEAQDHASTTGRATGYIINPHIPVPDNPDLEVIICVIASLVDRLRPHCPLAN